MSHRSHCPRTGGGNPFLQAEKNGIKYIIHTIGTHYQEDAPETVKNLRNCYRNALRVAKNFDCKSVAIPLLATGNYGFPKELALQVAQEEIDGFLEQNEDMNVILVVYDKESYFISQKRFDEIQSFIDENYVEQREREEWEENSEEDIPAYIGKPDIKTSSRMNSPTIAFKIKKRQDAAGERRN